MENEQRLISLLQINKSGVLDLPAMQLDGPRLDRLIQQLALVRADMKPEVAYTAHGDSASLMTVTNPASTSGVAEDGNLMLSLRHVGMGWVTFDFEKPYAAELRDVFARYAGQTSARVVDNTRREPGEPQH